MRINGFAKADSLCNGSRDLLLVIIIIEGFIKLEAWWPRRLEVCTTEG